MRVSSQTILGPIGNAADRTSAAFDANQVINASIQTIMGDTTAAGTVKVQGSNDNPKHTTRQKFTPTHWSDITGATVTVTAGVAPMIVLQNCAYQWLRVVWTKSVAGNTTVTIQLNYQSI